MFNKEEITRKVAEFLLQIKAVKLSPDKPFTWASGIKSPIYCDNRVTLSYPKTRTYIRQSLAGGIQEIFGNVDAIVGVATGGIAMGALVAEELGLPFAYVRAEAKSHGTKKHIDGDLPAGSNVIVIEDLVSTGMSSLKAVRVLRDHDIVVKGMAAIFTYGFPEADENFKKEKVKLFTLSSYPVLLESAVDGGYVQDKDLDVLKAWREDPKNWNNDN